jgi:galactokinase
MSVDLDATLRALAEAAPDAVGAPDAIGVVRAPGRINLIGEHTDYNEGFVLPMAIDREIVIAFVPTDDRRVELTRLDTGERGAFDLDAVPPRVDGWIAYVGGMGAELARRGVATRGLRGVIASTLPIEVGLSSSAAIEIAAAWALAAETPPLPPVELARAGQAVEHEVIGVRSGLMDQMAAVLGRDDAALLIDCRSLDCRAVPLPLRDHAVVAIDSGSARRLDASAYNERRAECEAVVDAIRRSRPEVGALRDVTVDALESARPRVAPTAILRAEHVVRENERVLACVAAFESGDLTAVGRLLAESHTSLRDLFEVSSPALDALVEIAAGVPGVVGARMTGAGFGGSIVAIAERDALDALRDAIAAAYPARTGLSATVHVVEPAAGAGPVAANPRHAVQQSGEGTPS